MINGMKQCPEGHRCFFNACLFDKDRRPVWYGDIDFTASEDTLQAVATARGETFYVTREQPFRWDGLDKKLAKHPDDRVVVFKP
jgi:hypothetical protein